jgi:D-alanyl-D-alanine carboxypeptidase
MVFDGSAGPGLVPNDFDQASLDAFSDVVMEQASGCLCRTRQFDKRQRFTHEGNKVALEDPIGRFVKGLTAETSAVTVRQLLTRSGGLGNFFSPENLPLLSKARTLSEFWPLVAKEKPSFEPGFRFEYSNSGFLLLGLMIERVSGMTYGNYLKRHIFDPAGMTNSSVVPGARARRALGLTAMPQRPAGPPTGMPILPTEGSPGAPLRLAVEAALVGNSAGGSYSNAADMQRFFAALPAGKLTTTAMRDAMLSQQIVASPARGEVRERFYGLGFGIGSYQNHRRAGHTGGTFGVHVDSLTFPDEHITIILLENRDPPMDNSMMRKMRSMLLDGASCNEGH